MNRGRPTIYEARMNHFTFSLPFHQLDWLKKRPEGASEWIRSKIESQLSKERGLSGIQSAEQELERAKKTYESARKKEQEFIEQKKAIELDEADKSEHLAMIAQIDEFDRELRNKIYIQLKQEFEVGKGKFKPRHRKSDAKIFLERLKEVEKIVPGQTKEGPSA